MAKKSKSTGGNDEPSLFSNQFAQKSRLGDIVDDPVEAFEEEVETVGARLRLAREDRGWSLHDVAAMLRLKAPQIQALENGQYNQLPGQTFVTGFLRSYANLLDLDAVAIVDLYKQEHSDGMRTPSLTFPEPTSEGRVPGTGLLLGTLMLSLVLIAGWFVYQESSSLDFERVADIPDHLADKVKAAMAEEKLSSQSGNLNETGINKALDTSESPEETSFDDTAIDIKSLPVTSDKQPERIDEQTNVVTTEAERENTDLVTTDSTESNTSDEMVATENAEKEVIVAPLASTDQMNTQELIAASDATVATATTMSTDNEPEIVAVNQVQPDMDVDEEKVIGPAREPTNSSYPQAVLDRSVEIVDEANESPLPRTFGVDNTTARVVLRARSETWVEIKPADGAPYLSRVLMPGDVYMAPDIPNLMMTTGNAGGLEIRVDGNEIASLGGNGAILRDIPLVADSLLDGSSVSQ